MIIVIVAGGSGTRLWPLSTNKYPKHLLSLTNKRSLLQDTVDRAEKLTSTDKIYIVSEKSHVEHVYDQLDNIPKENVLVEPARRGTASCIALMLSHIKKCSLDNNEAILFLWADHLIRDVRGFTATALKAGDIAERRQKVVLIGVEPTYPSTGLGYMKKGENLEGWMDVYTFAGFVEKPDSETAKKYFESGQYMWNTGYLVATLACFEKEMEKNPEALALRYNKLLEAVDINEEYEKLTSIAIDYEFSELLEEGVVMPGSFDWIDVGSFQDLHNISPQDAKGNYTSGEKIHLENSTNSYVRNDQDENIVVMGLDNVVVINSKNGLLVTNKNYAQSVGDVAKKIQEND